MLKTLKLEEETLGRPLFNAEKGEQMVESAALPPPPCLHFNSFGMALVV